MPTFAPAVCDCSPGFRLPGLILPKILPKLAGKIQFIFLRERGDLEEGSGAALEETPENGKRRKVGDECGKEGRR